MKKKIPALWITVAQEYATAHINTICEQEREGVFSLQKQMSNVSETV